MTVLLLFLSSLSCAAIFWVCGTFLLTADRPDCVRRATAQVGLLLAMAGAFAAGLVPFVQPVVPSWWSVLLRVGIALIAVAQYDKVFGCVQQAQHLAARVHDAPRRLAAWWAARLAIAHRNARLKR